MPRASPTTGMSTLMLLLIDVGSMSTWMILAPGANASIRPVMRSSNRAPTAMIRSESITAQFA